MNPREHHFFFAKKLIPTHTFQSTDMMFGELTGPKREAFVFYLWNEAGKAAPPPLPHLGVHRDGTGSTMLKLEVVGAIKSGDTEVVVISMPPTENPNEAVFLALVRRPAGPSVFFWERCRDAAGTGVSPDETVLAEVRPEGMRLNHGFHKGLDLESFKRALGESLGVSLDGLERSLPPITAAAFMGKGAGTGKGVGIGSMLATLLLLRFATPLVLFLAARVGLGALLGPLWPHLATIYMVLSLAIGICLLIWCYQVHDARRGQASFSPGMAVGGFLIPGANLVLAPLIIRSAWKATVGAGGGLLILLWWLFWLLEIALSVARSVKWVPPADLGPLVIQIWGYSSVFAAALAYGLLWHIVRSVNARV